MAHFPEINALAERVKQKIDGLDNEPYHTPEVWVSAKGVTTLTSNVTDHKLLKPGELPYWRIYRSATGRVSHTGTVTPMVLAALNELLGG